MTYWSICACRWPGQRIHDVVAGYVLGETRAAVDPQVAVAVDEAINDPANVIHVENPKPNPSRCPSCWGTGIAGQFMEAR